MIVQTVDFRLINFNLVKHWSYTSEPSGVPTVTADDIDVASFEDESDCESFLANLALSFSRGERVFMVEEFLMGEISD